MIKQFKVGDIIIFNVIGIGFDNEVGLRQQILAVDCDRYYTKFIDSNESNDFGINSTYSKECDLVGNSLVGENFVFDNGLPLIWDDII